MRVALWARDVGCHFVETAPSMAERIVMQERRRLVVGVVEGGRRRVVVVLRGWVAGA